MYGLGIYIERDYDNRYMYMYSSFYCRREMQLKEYSNTYVRSYKAAP